MSCESSEWISGFVCVRVHTSERMSVIVCVRVREPCVRVYYYRCTNFRMHLRGNDGFLSSIWWSVWQMQHVFGALFIRFGFGYSSCHAIFCCSSAVVVPMPLLRQLNSRHKTHNLLRVLSPSLTFVQLNEAYVCWSALENAISNANSARFSFRIKQNALQDLRWRLATAFHFQR